MCFTVQLSRFLSVFDSFDILSYLFWLVKNFFKFFQTLFCCQPFWKTSSNWMLSFCDSHIRLSYLFWLVNNFFNFFHNILEVSVPYYKNSLPVVSISHLTATLICYHIFHCLSITFFNFFFTVKNKKENGEGGIWTLARRKPSTPLAGAPLQPLEYFSNAWIITFIQLCSITWAKIIITNEMTFVNHFSSFFSITFSILLFTSAASSTDFIFLYSS